jgi:CO dehydrogenase maturation factor
MDMYAGVEHLGRATVDFVDTMLVVVEPTRRSLATANQIVKLAGDIGLTRLWLVGNRIRNQEDVSFIEQESGELPLLGYLPDDPGVIEADRQGTSVYALVPSLKEAAGRIADQLAKHVPVS